MRDFILPYDVSNMGRCRLQCPPTRFRMRSARRSFGDEYKRRNMPCKERSGIQVSLCSLSIVELSICGSYVETNCRIRSLCCLR